MTEEDQRASLTWRVTPDLMCILDREGRFVAVNPAWQATLGWPAAEMVDRPYITFVHPDDLDRSLAAFELVKSGKPVLRFENRYRTQAGDHRWLQWVAVSDQGSFYCSARDVTEDKAHVDRIADQQAEAELREQFIAVLGHDLRNPLAAIVAGTRVLQRRLTDEQSVEVGRNILGSAARMSELVDNLMDFARVRLGSGIELDRKETLDFETRLRDVVEEIKVVFPDIDIELDVELAQSVTCDVARVMQLVSNLLANAVTHGTPSRPIHVKAHAAGGRLRIEVANESEPIPDIVRERLFQPFFRGEVRPSKHGLGLGLYIASEIARAHEGSLSADSVGNQTRFVLDFPT